MHIGHDSFYVNEKRAEGDSQTMPHVEGDFLLTNTFKEFAQELDRKAILEACGKKVINGNMFFHLRNKHLGEIKFHPNKASLGQ